MTEKQAEELVRKNLEDYLHRMGHFPDNAGRYHCIAPDHKDGNPSMTIEKSGKYAKCWSHPQPRDTFNIFDAINMLEGIRSLHAQKKHAFAIYQIVIDEVATDKAAPDKSAPSKTDKQPKNGASQGDHAHQDHATSRAATPAKNHHARADVFRPSAEETTVPIGPVAAAAVPDPEIAAPIDTPILEAVPENVEISSSDDFVEIIEFGAVSQPEPTTEFQPSLTDEVKSVDLDLSVEVLLDSEPVHVEIVEPVPAEDTESLVELVAEAGIWEAAPEAEDVEPEPTLDEAIEPSFVAATKSPVEVTESTLVKVNECPVEVVAEVEAKNTATEPVFEAVAAAVEHEAAPEPVPEPVVVTAAVEPEPVPVVAPIYVPGAVTKSADPEPEPAVTKSAEPEPEPEAPGVEEPENIATMPSLVDRIEATCMADFLDEALAADPANTIGLSLPPAIPSGFTALDKHLDGGFFPGLYLFCSRPGEGKTTFALQIADAIVAQGLDVLLISMDLTRVELAAKSISRLSLLMDHTIARSQAKTLRQVLDVSNRKTNAEFAQSFLSQAMQAYRQTANHLHVLDRQERLSPNDVHKMIDRHIARTTHRPVVILDSLQHLQPMESGQTEILQADSAVRALMQISRSAGTPILALSSVIRDNYGSDVVLSLQLEPAAGTLAAPHHLDVKLLKNRHGAIDGKVGYNYYAAYNYFEEM